MNHRRRASPAHELHSYGLTGIELHRAKEQQGAEQQRDCLAANLHRPSRMARLRPWLGALLIALGTRIAGDHERPSCLSREIHTSADGGAGPHRPSRMRTCPAGLRR